MTFTTYKNDVPPSNVLKRLHDVMNVWQNQARSHATETGVHHLKNGVYCIIRFKNVPFGQMRKLLCLGYIIKSIMVY